MMINNKELKLCRVLTVEEIEDKEIFTILDIDQCLVDSEGKIELLTGEFAGEVLPSIYDDVENEAHICCWLEDISDAQRFIPTSNIDEIRDNLRDLLYDKKYVRNKNKKTEIYPLEYYEEVLEEEVSKLDIPKETSKSKKIDNVVELNEIKKPKNININNIIKEISKNVISQDEAIRKITTAIYANQKIFESKVLTDEQKFQSKKNILVIGETGSGKTEIIRQLTKILNLPYVIVDANNYTISGYKGKDVDTILLDLFDKTNNNYELARKGVVIIDEIDKLGKTDEVSSVATDGVQKSLLKMIEGAVITIEGDYFNPAVTFDTHELTFVCVGAFSELYDKRVVTTKHLGFGSTNETKVNFNKITPEQLVKYGLIPEFVGRIPVIVEMNKLTEEDYKKIIKNSKLSNLKTMKEFYKSLGVKLQYDEEFINEVARKTAKLKTGARGIKTILTEVFEEFETDVLSGSLSSVTLTKDGTKVVRKRDKKTCN